ncbi:MAG TPA: ABC transporter ATP-binding protein [Dongiaceae bacterium]|nr:ABC transporter ATP-binding protein [Dongiaceae bacterium]
MAREHALSVPSKRGGAPVALRGIVKLFDSYRAIDGLNLDIEPGEFITLLGPSGSGKSTTLMMIAGFEQPTAGEILIDGSVVTRTPPYRRNIGMVFQNYALFPHLTVAENIGFPLKQRGMPKAEIRERVQRMLELVKLTGFEARFPQQLSGGQQQRVAIARAIVFNPPVLLMDEPLSALDKKLREDLQLEIKGLHDRLGITFIYVTHDQKEALVMSDRVAVMNEGRIEQIGEPEALYDAPANRFVASFVGEANLLEADVVGAEAGLLNLKIAGVAVRAAAAAHAPKGSCLCMVRPEKISVRRSAAGKVGPGNSMPAIVRETVFMGEMIRYVLELPNGSLVIAKQQHRAGTPILGPAEAATIEWALEDTRLV